MASSVATTPRTPFRRLLNFLHSRTPSRSRRHTPGLRDYPLPSTESYSASIHSQAEPRQDTPGRARLPLYEPEASSPTNTGNRRQSCLRRRRYQDGAQNTNARLAVLTNTEPRIRIKTRGHQQANIFSISMREDVSESSVKPEVKAKNIWPAAPWNGIHYKYSNSHTGDITMETVPDYNYRPGTAQALARLSYKTIPKPFQVFRDPQMTEYTMDDSFWQT